MLEAQLLHTLHALTGQDPPAQRYLLAISGGLDSVVLGHLFWHSGLPFSVAHANFQLRGEESERDEQFVRELAEAWGVPCFVRKFDTRAHARVQGGSIQMAARELRYAWLEEVRRSEGLDWIVTAHHLDDSLETFFIHFLRGTGLRGLVGIPEKNGRVIRPFYAVSRTLLEAYYQEAGLTHREDASNAATDYLRNKIRHWIIPALRRIDPGIGLRAAGNMRALREALALYDWTVEQARKQAVQLQDIGFRIDWSVLEGFPSPSTILYELLAPYGFSHAQVAQAWEMRAGQPGKIIPAPGYTLLVDRKAFILEPVDADAVSELCIEAGESAMAFPEGTLYLEWIEQGEKEVLRTTDEPWQVYVNEQVLLFPLTLRKWRPGDVFCPFGMQGKHKKVQDLLTDLRLDRFRKERVWILENAEGQIVWVTGLRLDERARVDLKADGSCWRLRVVPTQFP